MNLPWDAVLFWIAAAVAVLVALAFVLPALMRRRDVEPGVARRDLNVAIYRDQLKEIEADRANGLLSGERYDQARRELEVRLADDALSTGGAPATITSGSRVLGATLAVALPAAAFALYFWFGNPASLTADPAAPDAAMAAAEQDFMQLIRNIEEKAHANPEDGAAWVLLARSYAFVERWPDALQAFEKARKLLPQDASVLTGYAEALAMTRGGTLAGQPMELVQQALAMDPDDTKGLELAAVHAFQARDFTTAAAYFGRLQALVAPDSPYAGEIRAAQQEAERLAGEAGNARAGATDVSNAVIRGRVEIAPSLKSAISGSETLFLFARPGAGGPPVAAIRERADALPFEFQLDDHAAMNPEATLSRHERVTLVARVSRSGNPMAQAGDLEGSVAEVVVGANGVTVVIDRVHP